jgi:two-component system cell cycle sensor histidine kinase PleC
MLTAAAAPVDGVAAQDAARDRMDSKRARAGNNKTTINSERAERRRAVARTVRNLREKLNSTTGTRPVFDYELALAFARNRIGAAFAIPLLILLTSAAALIWIDAKSVIVWAAVALAAHVVVLAMCRHFVNLPPSSISIPLWGQRFLAAEFGYGLAWAAILILTHRIQGTDVDVFQFATTLIVVAVGSMLAANMRSAAVAGTVPIVTAFVVLFGSRGDVLHVTLALMAAGAELFFLYLAGRMYMATLAILESRAEKDLLIAELGTAKAISDESRRRAEEANLAKSRFLATMSHELRTPLNAILGFSEVMKNEVIGPIDNPTYKEYATDIHASGRHLLNLINEILDLSRIEAGRYELQEESICLSDIVDQCCHMIQLKAHNKGITVKQHVEPRMPRLWADERAVRQIVLNLLSNALKFTQRGGEIEVKVGWTAGGGQYVSVRDNGPGIPEEEIPVVLSSFGQGSIAIKSAEQGTGLGLPIVQALVHMHEGTFDLKSKLREGTEAIAAFPRSRVLETLPPIPDNDRARWRKVG